jgi:ABC-type lipoprotein export system ATPase subunit
MTRINKKVHGASFTALLEEYPFIDSYLAAAGIPVPEGETRPLPEYLGSLEVEYLEEKAIDIPAALAGAESYIEQMLEFLGISGTAEVAEVTLLPGRDKSGNPEGFEELTIRRGEIISIVGPTGSGKSRLLADIEWMAQGDTPTGRHILVNGEVPDRKRRFSSADKLVAQLSQNMNFVMDLSAEEFIRLHAESRLAQNPDAAVSAIIGKANELAGEQFEADTPITSLSGGQSRALMIADTAILSRSPIVLIDEIENAGIDRKKALSLLLSEEKIVLMATHDPILALMANKRVVIKNGGIHAVIETSPTERGLLGELEQLDGRIQKLRGILRSGRRLESID